MPWTYWGILLRRRECRRGLGRGLRRAHVGRVSVSFILARHDGHLVDVLFEDPGGVVPEVEPRHVHLAGADRYVAMIWWPRSRVRIHGEGPVVVASSPSSVVIMTIRASFNLVMSSTLEVQLPEASCRSAHTT